MEKISAWPPPSTRPPRTSRWRRRGRICTPFAYLAGLYVLLAPLKSAIFVDLGPKMAKYGRWRPDTGVTHQLIAVLCSLVTMAAMYGHWLTHLRRICDIPYPISAPVIRRFVWGNALRGGESRGGASNGKTKTMRRRSSPSPTRWAKGHGPIRYIDIDS